MNSTNPLELTPPLFSTDHIGHHLVTLINISITLIDDISPYHCISFSVGSPSFGSKIRVNSYVQKFTKPVSRTKVVDLAVMSVAMLSVAMVIVAMLSDDNRRATLRPARHRAQR